MRQIYTSAFATAANNFGLYLILAVGFEIGDRFLSSGAKTGAQISLSLMFACALHRHFVLGEPFGLGLTGGVRRGTIARFALAAFLLLLVPVSLALVVALPMISAGAAKEVVMAAFMLVVLPCYFLSLCLFGTALPAAACGDRFGIVTTIRRGVKSFFPVAGGLLLSAVPFTLLMAAITGYLATALGITPDTARLDAISLILGVVTQLGGLVVTTMAVIVLCRAYSRVTAPPAVPPAMPWAA